MRSPASIMGHPLHPMFVDLPIGMWIFSLVSDIVFRAGGNAAWQSAALYSMGVGIIAALVAAVPGFVDLLAIKDAVAKKIGVAHMCVNLVIVALFAINFFMRVSNATGSGPLLLSVIAIALLVVSGGLGGSLVHVHHVAVEERHEHPGA